MKKTLGELADFVGGELVGDARVAITGISGIDEAGEGDLTFLANVRYASMVASTRAAAIITPADINLSGTTPVIRTANPSLAFAKIASLFHEQSPLYFQGIHPTAVISPEAKLGRNVTVGPYSIIEAGVKIGNDTVIFGQCYVARETTLGHSCVIYPQVSLRERVTIGNRVVIHNGTVVGSDGFGYVQVNGAHEKIPQIGTVEIHDDVEIGANVTIDRARFKATVIGQGTKIDNLVQIAHNVRIGRHCIICSQVGISGSSVLEDNVILAGQVGVAGHLTIGKNTVVASGSGVPSSIPANSTYWGFPAKPQQEARRINACVQRLPHYVKTINELKHKIAELETRLKE